VFVVLLLGMWNMMRWRARQPLAALHALASDPAVRSHHHRHGRDLVRGASIESHSLNPHIARDIWS
jgi:hypothetical protein